MPRNPSLPIRVHRPSSAAPNPTLQPSVSRHPNPLQLAALLALAGWALFNCLVTLHAIAALYTAVPVFDYWRTPEYLTRIQALDFRYLWSQHNEHRILFPDIAFALDVLLFHGRRLLPIVLSCLCYFACWLTLAAAFLKERTVPLPARAAALALTAVLLAWKGAAFVLADPFLLQWTLLEAALFTALALVPRIPAAPHKPWLLAALMASGIVAVYTSGNGLLIWAVLLPAAWLFRWNRRQLLLLTLCALLADALYFVGYHFTNDLHFLLLLAHPWYTLCFLAAYLSMPFGGMKSPQFGVYVGLANLALMLLLFTLAAQRRRLRSPAALLLFGSFSFLLLTVLLTAAGRMNVHDSYYTAAKATRYLIPVLLNWAALILALLWTASLSPRRAILVPALVFLLSLLMGISFLKLRWWLRDNTSPFVDAQIAEISLQNNVHDPRLLHAIFPDPGFIEHFLPLLQQSHLSLYYTSPGEWIGQPLTRFGAPSGTVTTEHVTTLYPVVSGLEVTGWTDDPSLRPFTQILFVNENGVISGTGRPIPLGLPAQFHPSRSPRTQSPRTQSWIGFLPSRTGTHNFRILLRDPHTGSLAQIPADYAVPPLTLVPAEQAGAPIPEAAWPPNPKWLPNDTGPEHIAGFVPQGPILGTWNGPAGVTAELRSNTFPAPSSNCLILPTLHGADTQLLSVQILDGATGRLLATLPMQDDVMEWQFWRVPLAGAKQIQLRAQDHGPGPREWLSVAPPALCVE